MRLLPHQFKKFPEQRSLILWLVGLLLAVFGVVICVTSWVQTRAEVAHTMETVLTISERALDRFLQQQEMGLRVLAADIEESRSVGDLARIHQRLAHYKGLQPELLSVNLVRMDGQMLVSSNELGQGGLPSIAAEPTFQEFLQHLPADGRGQVGMPRRGVFEGEGWVFPMRVVLRDTSGAPAAFLVAIMPVDLLSSFWKDAPATSDTTIGLLRDDGYLLSRFPVPPGTAPEVLYGQPRSGALRQYLLANQFPAKGQVEGVNVIGGGDFANRFMRLQHYPLTIFTATSLAEIRAQWWHNVRLPLFLLMVLAVSIVGAVRFFGRRQALWAAEQAQVEKLAHVAEAIRVSESEQRFLFDHLMSGVVVHEPDGTLKRCNPQACNLLGLSAEQMDGKGLHNPDWHFLREDGSVMPVAEYPVSRVLETGAAVQDLIAGVVQPGLTKPNWLLCRADPVYGEDGKLHQIVVTFTDITARRAAERKRFDSEQRFRLLYENSMDAVLQTLPDGSVLGCNPAAVNMFGLSEQEMLVRGRSGLVDIHDPRLQPLLEERQKNGRVLGSLTMLRGDGSAFEAEISSNIYQGLDGVLTTSMVVRDVSRRLLAEQALKASNAELARSNSDLEQFAYVASHDLIEPLRSVTSSVQLLQKRYEGQLDARADEYIAHAVSGSKRMRELIDDLLRYSRINIKPLKPGLVDMETALQRALDNLHIAIDESGAQITQDALPGVNADVYQITQLYQNLIGNALKFRGDQPALVHLGAQKSGSEWVFSVADKGIGIEPEYFSRIFELFQRLHTREEYDGTGIGLTLCKKIVERHSGRIWVESALGAGTVFYFTLPL